MSSLLFALAFVIVMILMYLGKYSGRIRAGGQQVLPAAPETVLGLLADWRTWPQWHLWLEPTETAPPLSGKDRLRWDEGFHGAGEARWADVGSGPAQRLQLRLRLLRPFSVRADIEMVLNPEGAGTLVRWRLTGRVAFALRAFATTVQRALQFEMDHSLMQLSLIHI